MVVPASGRGQVRSADDCTTAFQGRRVHAFDRQNGLGRAFYGGAKTFRCETLPPLPALTSCGGSFARIPQSPCVYFACQPVILGVTVNSGEFGR